MPYQEILQQGGVPEAQARAHAKAIEEQVSNDVMTKDFFETKLHSELADLKFEMLKWMVVTVAAATVTILVALVRFAVRP
jgi:hypothetical protein